MLAELVGMLRLQLDLLQVKADTGKLSRSVTDIDSLLEELSSEKLKIDTPQSLDPLVPVVYLIRTYFSLEEIDELAFECGFNPEEIGGETLAARARGLAIHARNNTRLADLLSNCEVKRPFVSWPPVHDVEP